MELKDFINSGKRVAGWFMNRMNESKKHKHYDMIEEWARTGKQVQMHDPFLPGWVDCSPRWLDNVEYRFKPEAVKYKRYLTRTKQGEMRIKIVYYGMENKGNISTNFVRWVDTEWQEVEV